jgi:hypothetical protein
LAISTFIKQCSRKNTGNKYLFVTEKENIESIGVTAGEVDDIVMIVDGTFEEIQPDHDTLIRSEEVTGPFNSKIYEQLIAFSSKNPSTELNDLVDELRDAGPCGIVALVMDNNLKTWLVGYNETDQFRRPLYLRKADFNSGKDSGEEEGGRWSFELFCKSSELAIPCNDTINTYILDCIAAGYDVGFTP